MSLTVILAVAAIILITVVAAMMLWKVLAAGDGDPDVRGARMPRANESRDDLRQTAATDSVDDPTLPLDETEGTFRDFNSADTMESDGA